MANADPLYFMSVYASLIKIDLCNIYANFTTPEYTASNGRMNDELEWIWKKAVLLIKVQYARASEGSEENNVKLTSGWPFFWARVDPNTSRIQA
jgi:hypothetical protein